MPEENANHDEHRSARRAGVRKTVFVLVVVVAAVFAWTIFGRVVRG